MSITAQTIIATIIEMHKDFCDSDVMDLLESKALVSWHREIYMGLLDHETSEYSAPNAALTWLSGRLTNEEKFAS